MHDASQDKAVSTFVRRPQVQPVAEPSVHDASQDKAVSTFVRQPGFRQRHHYVQSLSHRVFYLWAQVNQIIQAQVFPQSLFAPAHDGRALMIVQPGIGRLPYVPSQQFKPVDLHYVSLKPLNDTFATPSGALVKSVQSALQTTDAPRVAQQRGLQRHGLFARRLISMPSWMRAAVKPQQTEEAQSEFVV